MEEQIGTSVDIKLTPQMLDTMRETRRWTRVLSVFGFVITGVALLVIAVQTFFMRNLVGVAPEYLVMLVALPVLILVYFFPALLLYKYASSITPLLKLGDAAALDASLARQKSFWKYVGIMVVVVIGFYVIAIVAAIAIPTILRSVPGKQAVNQTIPTEKGAGQNCEQNMRAVSGAVQTGLSLHAAAKVADGGSIEYPSRLDSAKDGAASDSNRFFDRVVQDGVTNAAWSKKGNKYTHQCSDKAHVFEYDPKNGAFFEGD